MRLAGRLSAAIDVLADIEARKRPVSEALKSWGLNNRFAGSGDRAAIGNLVYDALRRRASHAHRMGSDDPRSLILAVAVADWGETPETLAAAFAEDRHAPAPPSPEESARLTGPASKAEPVVHANVPTWVGPSLERAFGAEWVDEMVAMTGRPSLDLRVNSLKSAPERVMKSLRRFDPQPAEIAPNGVRLAAGTGDARTPNVTADEGYLKGWFEVQDQGSQIVAHLAGARPGDQVLDICAGAGGKTLALAADMDNRGQIFAYDQDRTRLAPIYDRLKRNSVRNVQVRAPEPDVLDDLEGRMDLVLIDAPCTGTGTWRRRPDTKWKLTPELLAQRTAEQAGLLQEASRFVKPGGMLAYVTCSVLPEENRDQIASFLAARSDFAVEDITARWTARLKGPVAGHRDDVGGLTLTPRTAQTDGFYIAMLRRLVA
jgi:16S rRNA (cytosine967-C5)-methyltransferase